MLYIRFFANFSPCCHSIYPIANKSLVPEKFYDHLEPMARHRGSPITIFSDFVHLVACAFHYGQKEKEYFEIQKRYTKEEMLEFSKALGVLTLQMENDPFCDLLGTYYQEIGSRMDQDLRGEFYTPDSVSSVMMGVSMDVEEVVKKGVPITVNDPAVGSGRMIMQMAKQFPKESISLIRATLQDISPTAVHSAFINTAFSNIPAQIIHGNTLSGEVRSVWKNIHWLRVGEDERLKTEKMIHKMKDFMDQAKKSIEPVVREEKSVVYKEGEGGQLELF